MNNDDSDFEDEEVRCEVCDENILIEYYMDIDDVVTCEECGAEYMIESRDPVNLQILDENEDEDEIDFYDDEDYS